MADNILINTGTGPTIATDQVGTSHYQVIKIALGASDTASLLGIGQATMAGSLPVVVASNQSTLPVNVVAFTPTPTVTASQGGTWNIATVTTLLGTVAVSGGGGGVQYSVGDTAIAATGTGTLMIGKQSGATTARALVLTTSGGIFNIQAIATVSTLLGTVGVNVVAFTPGGTQSVAMVSGTVSTVLAMPVLSASSVTIASIAAGTISTVLAMPVLVVTASANPLVVSGTVTVPASGTQNTILVSGTVSTVLAMPVLSATGVVVASLATGTVTVANTSFPVIATAHSSKFNGYAVCTNSSNTILMTSGAHTLYVTDLLFSVDAPMYVKIFSAATTKAEVYLATKGGFVFPMSTPMVLNTAQSLTFTPTVSGSCAGYCAGYTVT